MPFARCGEMEEVTVVLPEHWGTPAVFVECLETLGKQRNTDGCCVTRHSSVRSAREVTY